MKQLDCVKQAKRTLPILRVGTVCVLCVMLLSSFIMIGWTKNTPEPDPVICNNMRLSDDDAIRQIASFFAVCVTDEPVQANSITYYDCEMILRTMLVHTDAIIDQRVKLEDNVVSVDKEVANDYIKQLFNRDLPERKSGASVVKEVNNTTIFNFLDNTFYFGMDGWSINKFNYTDSFSDQIVKDNDGVIKGTFHFDLNGLTQSTVTVTLTLVPSSGAFRYYVTSYEVTRESSLPVAATAIPTATPKPTATPYVCDTSSERVKKVVDLYLNKKYKEAVPALKELAEAGVAIAQRYLADAYERSRGVTGDANKAFYWYQEAAEQGNGDAQCFLGSCYRNGIGTAKDLKKMLYWYEKSVAQENMYGLINLGYCYHYGVGVSVDLDKAYDLYIRADAAGHPYAKTRLEELAKLGCGN